ncbi:MAG: hypothetical protein Q9163_002490 [Psora crenata]
MFPPFDYFEHRRACQGKQLQRTSRILSLPFPYHSAISPADRSLLSKPISELVQDVHAHRLAPIDILRCYGKIALRAHEKTNCLTEIMMPEAEGWLEADGRSGRGGVNLKGPLAGIPVSLKDTFAVGGFDVTIGYSHYAGKPCAEDGNVVKILKAAGAVPYVKTNLPTTLLSFESSNDVWGRCLNPHNTKYSPGGSTGGESALLAYGGGRIGIGSDVAGSVRVPAHFAGIYSLRCSTGRWPKMGTNTSMPGQEGVPSVCSPMARTLEDLVYFSRSFIGMRCWRWDHTVHPIAWRDDVVWETQKKERFKVGVLRTDGVVDPSPACARALEKTVSALRFQGHECIDISPPSPYLALQIASNLLTSDGCRTFLSYFRTGETNDPGARQMSLYMKIPRPFKYLYYLWVKYVRRDEVWAGLLAEWQEKSSYEQWKWVKTREAYKALWHEWWHGQELDFLVTPVNATPAVPHMGMKEAVSSCGYTFLFNLLDYTCGIIPVTKVDSITDQLPETFQFRRLNGVAKGAYTHYDADAMHGLPVAVQIVGQRLEEEKVLTIMERVEDALKESGAKYELLRIE